MPFTTAQYRAVLAAELGFFSGTLTTSAGAVNATDLICNTLIDSDFEASFLDGVWSLITSSAAGTPPIGTVRRIKMGGLAPATGTITHSRAYASTTSNGQTFELFGVLPPTDQLGRRGILTCMNLALRECWMEDYLSIVGVSNQYQYPLATAYPWLQQEDQIIDVWVRRSGANRDQLVSEWRLINDAETPQLEFKTPFTTSDTIKPYVHRPLDTWIATPTVWAESTTGLVNEGDQALLSLNAMRVVGLYHCFTALATVGDESERAGWQAKADKQALIKAAWKRANLKHDTGRDVHWKTAYSALVPAFPLEGSLGASDN